MRLALQDRQAVVMRANAACENGVAVVEQVVRGDGGTGVLVARSNILRRLGSGDVLEDDFEFGEIFAQRNELCVCLLYTSPSPRDRSVSRMPSSA